MDLRNGFDIKRYIRTIPDYPKPGILFRDITTLLANLHGFRAAVDELAWPFLSGNVDYVAGIEARGFILGDMLARARKHELAAPVLAVAAAHVQAYERRLNAKAA